MTITGTPTLASLEKLLRPFVIDALGDEFTAAQLRDALLATQSIQHIADFFSAEYCLRVARRMSLIARAAPVFLVSDFCLISVPFGYYDEPKILPYAISLICSIGADVRQ